MDDSATSTDASSEALGELASRVRTGDQHAERALVLRLLPGLSAMCRRHFNQTAAAADARQTALLILLQKLRANDIQNAQSIPAFLRGVVLNLSRDAARESQSPMQFDSEHVELLSNTVEHAGASALHAVEQQQLRQLVQRCMDEMPQARDRDILYRSYILEEDKQQVCDDLGLTSASFDRVISRAKQRLRSLLAPFLGHSERSNV